MLRKLLGLRDFPLSGVGSNETTGISIYDWAKMFSPGAQVAYGGNMYQAYKPGGTGVNAASFSSSPIVFPPAAVRILLFSEARFQWQRMQGGRPGDLFGNADLQTLEEPWAGHTTRDLLVQAELDVFAAGNSYWVKTGTYLQRLDPANVKLLTSKATDITMTGYEIGDELVGYAYIPDQQHITIFEPHEVCHYKPIPDVGNRFLGMSWLSPCLSEINTDEILKAHKQSVISNGASLATIVSFDPTVSTESFDHFVDKFRREHEGPQNASKTLFLGGGADVKTVGQTFENLALQSVQNAGEIRVAACAGVPPTIIGFSESLKGSSLNAGNYGEARRRLADGTMRPLWGSFASAMQSLLPVPSGARLWYDDRDIAFLREDLGDQSKIADENAGTILKLIQAGYEPDAVVDAVMANDYARLIGKHSGLFSVQLQPPFAGMPPGETAPELDANGKAIAPPKPAPIKPAPATPARTGSKNGNGNSTGT